MWKLLKIEEGNDLHKLIYETGSEEKALEKLKFMAGRIGIYKDQYTVFKPVSRNTYYLTQTI